MIFVFGSNQAGRHGKGAALTALRHHGAIYGQSTGLMGNAYALPTCGTAFEPLPLPLIKRYVDQFMTFAQFNPQLDFQVTRVGCGLGGYSSVQIAPMFHPAPGNCLFDTEWAPYFEESEGKRYWGTF